MGLRDALNEHRPGLIRGAALAIAIGAALAWWLFEWWTT